MNKIAFYIMNSKGFYVLKNFIDKFGSSSVSYVVSGEDKNIQKDFFEEIKELAIKLNFLIDLKILHRLKKSLVDISLLLVGDGLSKMKEI